MYRFLFLVLFIVSCSTQNAVKIKPVPVKTDDSLLHALKQFLETTVSDSKSAAGVITKHRIIQHLTHLRKMNNGGRKFYLLEKENITEMINAVTKGIYDDYLLINKHGTLIYSRSSDELFGADILHGFEDSPLFYLFKSGKSGIKLYDVSPLSSQRGGKSLYISIPVFVENSFHGILILKSDQNKIVKLSKKEFLITDSSGTIRVSRNQDRIYKNYENFSKMKEKFGFFKDRNKTIRYYSLKFLDLNWNIFETVN